MKMTEAEYISKVIAADIGAVTYAHALKVVNDEVEDFYNCSPWREQDGHSSVISTDVQDVVESDMPSLVEVFLGSNDILTFEANTANEMEVLEAEQKTAYVSWIIKHQKDSFKLIHDWIKTAEVKKFSVLRYDWVEEKKATKKKFSGLSQAEYFNQLQEWIKGDERNDTDITITKQEETDDGWTLEANIKTTVKSVKIIPIPTDNFRISRNAKTKDDAEIVGDDTLLSRGELIAAGFDKEKVMKLPASGTRTNGNASVQNHNQNSDVDDPASELIVVSTRCIKIDRDGDGIAERRKVIFADTTILSDEPFDHVNYALLSTILMPNEAIGKSRGEITVKTQEVKTVLVRGMVDNTYRVNAGRVVVNSLTTNVDDLLTQRASGIVRTKGDVRQAVAQLETPYVADKTLQVVQYIDFAKAQRTGTLMASQGLNSDTLSNETATRTNAVGNEGKAKIKLVARVLAETGMKDLYEGIAWTVSHYQDDETEIMVLGSAMTVDPTKWKQDQYIIPNVGLAAGDEDDVITNMSGLLQIHAQLKAQQSPLTDDKKVYNITKAITKAMKLRKISDYFNDPEIPEQVLLAQNEQLMTLAEQQKAALEQLQNNPLAEAELVKREGDIAIAQGKLQLDAAKLAENQRQFDEGTNQTNIDRIAQLEKQYVELELKYNQDVPGKGIE